MILKRILLLTLVLLICSNSLLADQNKETKAIKAAESWLLLVDGAKYDESWTQASQYFKKMVSKAQWEGSLNSARTPLGVVLSRKLVSKQFFTSLPGAPDGEYVVLQYATSFQNKASSLETITPSLEKDGIWKVAGYYIK